MARTANKPEPEPTDTDTAEADDDAFMDALRGDIAKPVQRSTEPTTDDDTEPGILTDADLTSSDADFIAEHAVIVPEAEPTADVADDPAEAFGVIWGVAVSEVADGYPENAAAIPAVTRDAVAVAFRAIPAKSRLASLGAAQAATAQAATAGGTVNGALMLAAANLAVALAQTPAKPTREAVPERDPLDIAAERVAVLTVAADSVYALMGDDERATVLNRADAILAGETRDDLVPMLARVLKASAPGKRAASGTRAAHDGPRRSITDHVVAVLADASEPMTPGQIAKIATADYPDGASSGAVSNALQRLADAGRVVIITTTDSGAPRTAQLA